MTTLSASESFYSQARSSLLWIPSQIGVSKITSNKGMNAHEGSISFQKVLTSSLLVQVSDHAPRKLEL
jgi:hypothetical protein